MSDGVRLDVATLRWAAQRIRALSDPGLEWEGWEEAIDCAASGMDEEATRVETQAANEHVYDLGDVTFSALTGVPPVEAVFVPAANEPRSTDAPPYDLADWVTASVRSKLGAPALSDDSSVGIGFHWPSDGSRGEVELLIQRCDPGACGEYSATLWLDSFPGGWQGFNHPSHLRTILDAIQEFPR